MGKSTRALAAPASGAFGVGGTNAHVVLEQPPERHSSPSTRSNHLLVLSARSPTALDQATDNLAAHLKSHPDLNLADVGLDPARYRPTVVRLPPRSGCRQCDGSHFLAFKARPRARADAFEAERRSRGLFSLSRAGIAAPKYGARDL